MYFVMIRLICRLSSSQMVLSWGNKEKQEMFDNCFILAYDSSAVLTYNHPNN